RAKPPAATPAETDMPPIQKKPDPVTRGLAKVTRRNGETVISNPRSNGYAPNPNIDPSSTHA
ncbi:hypothetical protein, partial [Pseudomonas sp. W15Feb9B]|uniref:hypothetical protein n=1 Tax=Pseudomonas sp. W15Feb9B TaxID=550743 RepID=UPI001C4548DF